MKIVINRCFGGFGLSDAAYEKLIEWGVPVKKYGEEDSFSKEEVIYDRELTPLGEDKFNDIYHEFKNSGESLSSRYWDSWTRDSRTHPLIIRAVEELGDAANGRFAELKVVEIPDGIEWEIDEYDGMESIHETHREWH